MHVALIASARHPIRRPFMGGLESHTYHHARALRARGHRVTVFAGGGDDDLEVDDVLADAHRFGFSDAAMDDVSAMSLAFLAEHHAYLSLMRALAVRDDIDVVHNESLHYLPIAMAPDLPSPVVTTLHTPPTPWLESAFATLPDPDRVRVVSVSDTNAAAWHLATPIEVVPNGIPLEEWPFVAEPASDRAVWMGRIVPEKGPELAIDACRALGMDLVLAGPVADPDFHAAEVVPRLGDGITHVGHLANPELAELVGTSRVLLATPRWDEPYGLVVAEALATGTPVAALDRGAVPELLTARTGVVAASEDPEDLAAAVVAAGRLDRADARAWAEQHASIDVMVDRYEAIYRDLAAA